MANEHHKAKRWRPRFSLRTLLVVMTLICCFFAGWPPTREQGIKDVAYRHYEEWHFNWGNNTPPEDFTLTLFRERNLPSSPLPFVVSNYRYEHPGNYREYHFWFFGYIAKLPFEREVSREQLSREFGD